MTYWMGTPRWTCVVIVDPATDRITMTAPLLRVRWRRRSWQQFLTAQQQEWGRNVRIVRLDTEERGLC